MRESVRIDPAQWAALSRLLDQALEVPAATLEQWLATLPPDDAVHRPKLRELLKRRAVIETGDFLLTLPKVASSSEVAASAVGVLAPGTVIGRYIIEEEIGRGGMGAVWRARRRDGLIKYPLALKLPHAGPYSQELVERFTRERDILGELSHPNIARLHDAGVTESGQPFLALEYVPGLPLTDYCRDLRLGMRARLRLFLQVLHAVQYAHSRLVIHKDLKPSNIIVTHQGQAMLVDFGIAKLLPDDGHHVGTRSPHARVKKYPGTAALTPHYASPEQIAGGPVSTASDIYSLGVLLFELLTGERPYQLDRPTSRSALETAIVQTEPRRPSSIVRALRGDLEMIVLHTLKKSPAERYQSATALAADIERYLRCEPVSVRADGTWYRLYKFVERSCRLWDRDTVVTDTDVPVAYVPATGTWSGTRSRSSAAAGIG
jgi:eukaryotic-like serine/threonine-protein kinase